VRRLGATAPPVAAARSTSGGGVSDGVSPRWILLVLPLIALTTSLATLAALRWVAPW
jgi:hypothetical protein